MRLATMRLSETTRAAVETESGWILLPYGDVGDLLNTPNWRSAVNSALSASTEAPVADTDARFASVIATPRKVICCGLNYSDHILEMGRSLPTHPTLFAKYSDTLTGSTDPISAAGSRAVDWEAELAVVVGSELSEAGTEEAASAIAGYCVANDVSMRDWQNRTLQWFQGKNFTASTPLGPWLTTADEFDDDPTFVVEGWINDEQVQRGETASLVFSPVELLEYVSTFTTLRPGDVILTGTPGGVGQGMDPPRFAISGDVIRTHIEGLGTLINPVTV
ncbi:FAA hydrolase family protein [Brevibacterium sp. LS14]|nr:fumarylacetoacetate hydrolase family protein [Brevibacterium casei]NJE66680.1 FAA hydrolase family protein [Brevibacterium sp. LS14]QQT69420.1 fumarylacetoacetate hydrolase family protein [Brevibacterium casei]